MEGKNSFLVIMLIHFFSSCISTPRKEKFPEVRTYLAISVQNFTSEKFSKNSNPLVFINIFFLFETSFDLKIPSTF